MQISSQNPFSDNPIDISTRIAYYIIGRTGGRHSNGPAAMQKERRFMKTRYRLKPGAGPIAILLLMLLAGILAAVFVIQARYDRTVFNPQQVLAASLQQQEQAGQSDTLFAETTPEGFTLMTAMEQYGPDNLYEKINGKAPLYLDSGFEQLRTQRFVHNDNEQDWFELYLYDMGTPQNAFSVYSTQKRLGVRDLDLARYAYETDDALFAAAGEYYIELIGTGQSDGLIEPKRQTLMNLIGTLDIADGPGDETPVFPAEGLMPGTESLSVAATFGYEPFTNVYTAQYEAQPEPVMLFYTRRDTAEQAGRLGKSYIKFLRENGADPVEADIDFAQVLDFYGMIEVVFVKGDYVAGVHAASDAGQAVEFARRLYENLPSGAQQ